MERVLWVFNSIAGFSVGNALRQSLGDQFVKVDELWLARLIRQVPATTVADAYIRSVEGVETGKVFQVWN